MRSLIIIILLYRLGSWQFIIIQTVIVAVWMTANMVGFMHHWEIYSLILLNLSFSTQAAYATPIITMAQTGRVNVTAMILNRILKRMWKPKKEIWQLLEQLKTIEINMLYKIQALLQTPAGNNK